MSIEAIRELETLASVCPELNMANYTEDDVRHLNDWAIEMSLLAEKVAAIQQAEAQQVENSTATTEPVVVQHRKPIEGLTGETIGYTAWRDGKGLDWWPHRDLYDHPATSVPADVVRDAERFRCLTLTEEAIAVVDSMLTARVGGKQ